jgi:hypothetical protein
MKAHCRFLADCLTLARALISVTLPLLGVLAGPAALSYVVLLVLVAWFTDLVDGPLARRAEASEPSWIGRHDGEVDLGVALGVGGYLITAGFLNPWLGLALLLAAVTLRCWYSMQLAWPLQALFYLLLANTAWRRARRFVWLILGYLLFTLAVRRERLWHKEIPAFFEATRSLLAGRR